MQVSKGLKRATGRGEQVQHHLGTLNFDRHPNFSMAVSHHVPRLDAPRVSIVLEDIALPSLQIVAKPAKLDFAANPNHYRVNGKVGKAKSNKKMHGPELSLRLELANTVENDNPDEAWEGHDFSRAE